MISFSGITSGLDKKAAPADEKKVDTAAMAKDNPDDQFSMDI